MSDRLQYNTEEMAIIDGVIGGIFPRMVGSKLQKSYWILHEHLQSGVVNEIDLRRIESALELVDPGQCVSFHKEDYRDYTQLRLKTQAMLRQAH